METSEDIVKEMRGHEGHCLFDEEDLASLADRIEEATKTLESRSKRLAEIEKALGLFWVDEYCRPLTGEDLADAATEDPYDYNSLRDKLMDIQNIVFRNEVDHGNG